MFTELNRTYIIADAGINHNGDIAMAMKLVSAAHKAGADCVKFQKRQIDLVYTSEELNSYRESKWGDTFRAQKEGLELSKDDYAQLQKYCDELGIAFTASPWDRSSVRFLDEMDVPFIKVPSAKATDKDYLEEVADTKLPIVLSTGMCTEEMINAIVFFLEDKKANLQVILSCTSTYPTQKEELDLNRIKTLINRYSRTKYTIGWSGHDTTILTGPLAVACGARVVERHITLNKRLDGSDQKASLEPSEFEQMVNDIRFTETVLGSGEIKIYPSERPIIAKLRKISDF
jgi:N-acetylneuraminate synthase